MSWPAEELLAQNFRYVYKMLMADARAWSRALNGETPGRLRAVRRAMCSSWASGSAPRNRLLMDDDVESERVWTRIRRSPCVVVYRRAHWKLASGPSFSFESCPSLTMMLLSQSMAGRSMSL